MAIGTSGSSRQALTEINVTPLVDVMLVLLIIFMVTAPMIQRGIDINLPVSRRAAQIADERVFVNVPLAYRQNRIVYLNEEPLRVDVLRERIRQKMENRSDKEVYLRGDGSPPHSVENSYRRAYTALTYRQPSLAVETRVRKDPGDQLVHLREVMGAQGGLPIVVDGDVIGAVAVSGSPGGDKDEACAQAGIDKAATLLK